MTGGGRWTASKSARRRACSATPTATARWTTPTPRYWGRTGARPALWEDGDFNDDTFVDDKDAAILAANWTESVVEPILGDANGDGVVDDEDASILGAHWLQPVSGGWDDGDFNTDGVVNDKDAAILAANWHAGAGAEEGSVPEPSTLVLLLGAAAMAWLGRRR